MVEKDAGFSKDMIVEKITDTVKQTSKGLEKQKKVDLTSSEGLLITLTGEPDTLADFIRGTEVSVKIDIAQKRLVH